MKKSQILIFMVSVFLLLTTGVIPLLAASDQKNPIPQKTWNLKYHHHTTGPAHELGHVPYAKAIENATKHRVKITIYPWSALGKMTEAYDLVTGGVADIAWGLTAFFPGQFPMTEIMALPLLGCPNALVGSKVMWDLYEKFPRAYGKEYGEVKLLLFHSGPPALLATSKKPVRTMEDLKGLNIRTLPGPPTEMLKALGANPMQISVADTYLALEKGVVGGYTIDWPGVESFKWYEVSNYFTEPYLYLSLFWIIINKHVWDSMPKDLQEQIMSVSGKAGAEHFGTVWDKIDNMGRERIKSMAKKEIIPLSKGELARWMGLAEPIHSAYIKKLEAKGLSAQSALDFALERIKEYSKK